MFLKIIKFSKLKTIFLKKLNFFARVLIWFLEQVVMMSGGYKKTIFWNKNFTKRPDRGLVVGFFVRIFEKRPA